MDDVEICSQPAKQGKFVDEDNDHSDDDLDVAEQDQQFPQPTEDDHAEDDHGWFFGSHRSPWAVTMAETLDTLPKC